MKRLIGSCTLLGLAIYVAVALPGCAPFRSAGQTAPEPVGNYVVLVYELPFVYKKGSPRQEAFLSVIREVIAPADWQKGPDNMTAIANIMVVSTTAQNHMRLERFFDSLPDIPAQHSEVWSKPPKETEKSE